MRVFTTGPVARGLNTDRAHVEALNLSRTVSVRVRVRVLNLDRCPKRLIFSRLRTVPPRCDVFFDAGLGGIEHYEVQISTERAGVLFFVTGRRDGLNDPSTTFRHTELVRLL